MKPLLESALAGISAVDLVERLMQCGVPAAPLLPVDAELRTRCTGAWSWRWPAAIPVSVPQ